MKNTVNLNSHTLVNADSLDFIKTLPDNCIDLIATDPPYFRVKKNAWDNQWSSEEQYLKWLDDIFAEFWRVLKPAGSLYVFCGWRLASDTELLMRKRFNVLNHIIWAKPSGRWNGCRKEDLRSYFPATERVLFAQHHSGPRKQKEDVYSGKCADLKRDVFRPLIDYFRNARAALKVTSQEINAATGKQMASHWFSDSQWKLPSEMDYSKLQRLFSRIAAEQQQQHQLDKSHSALADDYATLSRQYSELVNEYDRLRRPFSVSALVPYTDVWTYPPVQFYPGKHPCEKPAEMMSDIIAASSRPGDIVADFFMGSGVTIKEALKLGRNGLGVELEEDRFQQTEREILNMPF
ncbi:DNA-methyltransferase [Lonsdalea quercina]|uniref:DNA-methyltransferase n=1 Tax=Lonsdalea quercina TaxID=71657 RepID=UPI00397514D2